MKPSSVAVGVGASAIAVVFAVAPVAVAGTVSPVATCTSPLTGPQSRTVSLTVTGPASATAGATVRLSVTADPVPGPVPGNIMASRIGFDLSGGATGPVVTGDPVWMPNIPPGSPASLPPAEVDFVMPASASGPVHLTPTSFNLITFGSLGSPWAQTCVVQSGSGVVTTITV